MSYKRRNKKKSNSKSASSGNDDEKKVESTTTSLKGSNNKPTYNILSSKRNKSGSERIYYVTKETIKKLNTDKKLLQTLKKNFEAINASIEFENNQLIIEKGKLDNERVLKMVQEIIKLAVWWYTSTYIAILRCMVHIIYI